MTFPTPDSRGRCGLMARSTLDGHTGLPLHQEAPGPGTASEVPLGPGVQGGNAGHPHRSGMTRARSREFRSGMPSKFPRRHATMVDRTRSSCLADHQSSSVRGNPNHDPKRLRS